MYGTSVVCTRSAGPTRVLFGVVAGFAESCAVGQGGGSAGVPGDDVVDMADGRVAVGGAAGVVPGFDEASEPWWEEPGFGVGGQQFTCGRCCVEPPEPHGELIILRGAGAGTGVTVRAGAVARASWGPGRARVAAELHRHARPEAPAHSHAPTFPAPRRQCRCRCRCRCVRQGVSWPMLRGRFRSL
jgi:hypothetical protein